MVQVSTSTYEFDEFQLDVEARLLWRENSIVDVTPKALEILCLLVKNSGQVITKEEILKQVWSDSFVEEANLSHHIFRLRKALGETSEHKFIETIPKRGYRFVADVELLTKQEFAPQTLKAIDTDETAFSAKNSRRFQRRTSHKLRWVFILIVPAIFLGSGFWFLHLRQTPGKNENTNNQNFPPMKVVPLTSFPNDEFDSALSPDGKYTAFAWFGEDNKNLEIYVKQTDAGKPLRLTDNIGGRDGSPAWSPDGRFVAFTRQSHEPNSTGLYVVPAFGGTERKLLTLTAEDLLGTGLDWSDDGKTIVFSSRQTVAEPFVLNLLNVETLEVKQLTSPKQSYGDSRPVFSPDGTSVAFSRDTQDSFDVYLANLGGETRRITFDNLIVIGMAWKPDGKSLIFSSNRGGNFALWRVKIDGDSSPEPLIINAERAFDPSISRTGNRLSFTQIQMDSNIWRVRGINGGKSEVPVQLIATSRNERNPHFSPDGERIAYSSDISGSYEIWTSNTQGLNSIQLTNFGGAFTNNPRWSPDSSQIIFDSCPGGYSDIFVVSAEGGTPRRLTSGTASSIAPSYSHDGRWIYYGSNTSGTWQIWRIPAGGGQAEQITRQGGLEALESFDEQKLFYTKYDTSGVFEISLSDPSVEKLLFPLLDYGSFGDWTVAQNGIYYIMRNYKTQPTKAEINFFNFETRKIETITELDKDPGSHPGLNLSPDGQWFILSKEDFSNHDISLVENFR